MRGILRGIGPVALSAGVILRAEALETRAARVTLVPILPVITGTAAVVGLATELLLAGIFFVPLAFAADDGGGGGTNNSSSEEAPSPDGGSGAWSSWDRFRSTSERGDRARRSPTSGPFS